MGWLKKLRRKWFGRKGFPDDWMAILEENVPYYNCLPELTKVQLQDLILIFVHEKWFEGASDLQINDEIRVTIAAQACILLLNRDSEVYPKLRTIIVYPEAYKVSEKINKAEGTIIPQNSIRHGESWDYGTVVLSWKDVLRGAANKNDGRNLVFHEFAHQLDSEGGSVNGAPYLPKRSMYRIWAEVLGEEFGSVIRDLNMQRSNLLGMYSAENPAEFFAVATERFFERPRELQALHPKLYGQFADFYKQDPVAYMDCYENGQ